MIDVLFVPFDAGEALAFEPVLSRLEEKGITYKILAFATARKLYRAHPQYFGLRRDLGFKADVGPMNWPRRLPLSESEVSAATDIIDPRLVIVGMVSEVQRQFAEAFRRRGKRVVGYMDAVHRYHEDRIEAVVLPFVEEVWVPAERVADSLPNVPFQIVGQPSLSTWTKKVETAHLEEWLASLPAKPHRVLYCSGYGEDFVPSFQLFVRVAKQFSDANTLISIHPRVSGKLERELLIGEKCDELCIVPREFSSSLIAHCVDAVVCYRSSAGFQALFLGKPVIYALSGAVPFSNLPIDLGLVPKVCTEDALNRALSKALVGSHHPDAKEAMQSLGIPEDSVEAFFTQILQEL